MKKRASLPASLDRICGAPEFSKRRAFLNR
jgi:hypothetical protein